MDIKLTKNISKDQISYLLENDSLGVRSASEGVGLPSGSQMGLFVVLVGPDLGAAVLDVLTCGPQTPGLTHVAKFGFKLKLTNFTGARRGGKGSFPAAEFVVLTLRKRICAAGWKFAFELLESRNLSINCRKFPHYMYLPVKR